MNNAVQAFCWMLLHSLWQGLLLAVMAGLVMLLTKKATAAVRYSLLVVLFGVFLLVCGYTFVREWGSVATVKGSLLTGFDMHAVLQDYGVAHWPTMLAQYCSGHALVIVTIWLVLFALRCWQIGRGIVYMRRIRTKEVQDAGADWQHRLDTLTRRLQIDKVILLKESAITRVPVVIGHLKPVIYMPVGLLANIPYEQVEAVLLHELAHIRRHDFVVNLLQQTAIAVFFFNPGLLWVSSLIKQEREHCCDDIALQHTRRKKSFIEVLISFKEHALSDARFAMAFPGRKNLLVQRVTRIIQDRNSSLNIPEKLFFVLSLLVMVVLLAAVSDQQPSGKSPAAQQPVTVARFNSEAAPMTLVTEAKPASTVKKRTPRRKVYTTAIAEQRALASLADMQVTALQEKLQAFDAVQQKLTLKKEQILEQQHHFDKEREQAELLRKKAEEDRLQAEKARFRAEEERRIADKYREAAEQERRKAELERSRAEVQRAQADADRARAEDYRQQAAVARERAGQGRYQAERARAATQSQHP